MKRSLKLVLLQCVLLSLSPDHLFKLFVCENFLKRRILSAVILGEKNFYYLELSLLVSGNFLHNAGFSLTAVMLRANAELY